MVCLPSFVVACPQITLVQPPVCVSPVWSHAATHSRSALAIKTPLLAHLLYYSVTVPVRLDCARAQSSHWIFTAHDSLQKLCSVTNRTVDCSELHKHHIHVHVGKENTFSGSVQVISKNGKANKYLGKNWVQICASQALVCRHTAAGHVFRPVPSWCA